MRKAHTPGEKMFVDWAGPKVPICGGRPGGNIMPASLFVAVLGASTFVVSQAIASQDLPNCIPSHIATFLFFNGTTIIPCEIRPHLHQIDAAIQMRRPLPQVVLISIEISKAPVCQFKTP